LNAAADALREKFPLAATVLLRAMIDFSLIHSRAKRYGHAANHLRDCEAMDLDINDYGDLQTHDAYYNALQTVHSGKTSFWAKLDNR